jgi:hypothetical protein
LAVGMEEYSRRGSNQRMRPERARKPTISNRWFSGNFRPALTITQLGLPAWKDDAAQQRVAPCPRRSTFWTAHCPSKSQKDSSGGAHVMRPIESFISAERNSESGGLMPAPAMWPQSDGMTRDRAPVIKAASASMSVACLSGFYPHPQHVGCRPGS